MHSESKVFGRANHPVRLLFHWVSAVLVLGLLGLGLYITRIKPVGDQEIAELFTLFSVHKTVGLLVLSLSVLRLFAMNKWPLSRSGHSGLELFAASTVQTILMLALFAMPVTGMLQGMYVSGSAPVWVFPTEWLKQTADPNLSRIFARIHSTIAFLIIFSLFGHIGGALKHHILDRDNTLTSMFTGAPQKPETTRFPRIKLIGRTFGSALMVVTVAVAAIWFPGSPRGSDFSEPSDRGMWVMDENTSKLEVLAVQGGFEISASFGDFRAIIDFDPKNLAAASILVEIAANSFSSGLPNVDETVLGTKWLDAPNHPFAVWKSTDIFRVGNDQYLANGILDIRGVIAPVTLRFDLVIDAATAHAKGVATFDRTKIELGRGEDATRETAEHDIKVKFEINATKRVIE